MDKDRIGDAIKETKGAIKETAGKTLGDAQLTAESDKVADADIYARLTKVFRDVFDDDELVVTAELTADDVPEWDSMSHVRLMLTVERSFATRFAAGEITSLKNVGDLMSLIRQHVHA